MNAFKAFIRHFVTPQRSVKIKIEVHFLSLSRIGMGRDHIKYINLVLYLNLHMILTLRRHLNIKSSLFITNWELVTQLAFRTSSSDQIT